VSIAYENCGTRETVSLSPVRARRTSPRGLRPLARSSYRRVRVRRESPPPIDSRLIEAIWRKSQRRRSPSLRGVGLRTKSTDGAPEAIASVIGIPKP